MDPDAPFGCWTPGAGIAYALTSLRTTTTDCGLLHSCHRWVRIAAIAIAITGFGITGSLANDGDNDAHPINVFELSANASLQRKLSASVAALIAKQQYGHAEKLLRRILLRYPQSALLHYNLAAVLSRQSKVSQALDSLATAIEHGFANRDVLKHSNFDAIRNSDRFHQLIRQMDRHRDAKRRAIGTRIKPYEVTEDTAIVSASNTIWDPNRNLLFSLFQFSPSPQYELIVNGGNDPVARQLNEWFRAGQAAGNHGDLYDNRDRGHSRLRRQVLPQVTHIEYAEQAREAGFDYGVNANILFNSITFGNSSTALTGGSAWRSQARLILTTPHLVGALYLQHLNNHLYVYPEHRDHDPDRGDLIPANTPYLVVSQGSSGSDQLFLQAIGETLAAFKPDVKTFLKAEHLVVPTLQMILRRSLKTLEQEAHYETAKAHPSVFDAEDIDRMRMIQLANSLEVNEIPPRVVLEVLSEDKAQTGVDYFAPSNVGEVLFDTPGSIARVVRSVHYKRRMVVSAANTRDPNGRKLTFRWVVLRGDAERIKIQPANSAGTIVKLDVPWHERRDVPFAPELSTDRVDIAVFAHNGKQVSAPAFISFLYPANQLRKYDESERIEQVIYNSPHHLRRYVDPQLFPTRNWRDEYLYTKEGQLIGWNRVRGDVKQRYTRHGAKVIEFDSWGRPLRAERVGYNIKADKSLPRIAETMTGKYFQYDYSGPTDYLGRARAEE